MLVRHAGPTDSETGGQFTVKLYREERGRVVLQPRNEEYEPLVMEAGEVRVIAEVVEVVG